jgi:2,4-dienoyl-CoA reductase-like NADH-dependent reductase (Old Yellow Enzyme family)
MSKLMSEFKIRETTFRNRLWVSPMCQYSSVDGMPNDWHLVHLGSRAVGGAGAVFVEATAVSPEGRISPSDMGIWSDDHRDAFSRITKFLKDNGAVPGIQIAHAGRKASTAEPWNGGKLVDEGWETVAPSAIAFADDFPMPREMTALDLDKVMNDFVDAAQRAVQAGFEVIELHAAHGYLLHEFLSPLSNHRTDEYGGELEARMRFPLEIASAVRSAVPQDIPLFVRISATDWAEGGWNIEQSIEFCRQLKGIGIDLIDCSSGGLLADAVIPVGPGYQVQFAAAIRAEVGIATAAVGLITEPEQAAAIVENGEADAVMMAREFLRDPYVAFRVARELGEDIHVPKQYGRAIDLRQK